MLDFKILQKDIDIINPNIQQRYVMVKITNQALNDIAIVHGRVISGNVSIDATSETRRTASLSMVVDANDVDKIIQINTRNYIRIYWGVRDPRTAEMLWYRQGTFIITGNSFNYDAQTRTLTLSLSDRMTDLTGERKGAVYGYSVITKNNQRIDNAIKKVLTELAEIPEENFDIMPIAPLGQSSFNPADSVVKDGLMIPYDLKFGAGVTVYDILKKLVELYPGYEMFFDRNGKFHVQRQLTREDGTSPSLGDELLGSMVISEENNFSVPEIKNVVDVWGKDGKYYGTARSSGRDNPFDPNGIGTYRYVEVKDTVEDRYRDVQKVQPYLQKRAEQEKIISDLSVKKTLTDEDKHKIDAAKKQIESIQELINSNIALTGDAQCEQWAKYILDKKERLYDSIKIHCIGIPCINEAGIKIAHKSRFDAHTGNWIVQSINHDLGNNTTDITAIRSYGRVQSSVYHQIDKPTVINSVVSGMTVSVTATAVEGAATYYLYLDGMKLAESKTPTISYTMPEGYSGKYVIGVVAGSDDELTIASGQSFPITVELGGDYIVDNEGNTIITNEGDNIIYKEG